MNSPTAVVAAGGFGTRCGSEKPKALLRVAGHTYLQSLLDQLYISGIRKVIIFCNRPTFIEYINSLCKKFEMTKIIIDDGVNSTIDLAIHSVKICDSSNILFCYGHTPRPAQHLNKLLQSPNELAVTLVERTSKRKPLSFPLGGFVEPPYRLSSLSLLEISCKDWTTYFRAQGRCVAGIPSDGPGEFNHENERKAYDDYVTSWSSDILNKGPSVEPERC